MRPSGEKRTAVGLTRPVMATASVNPLGVVPASAASTPTPSARAHASASAPTITIDRRTVPLAGPTGGRAAIAGAPGVMGRMGGGDARPLPAPWQGPPPAAREGPPAP